MTKREKGVTPTREALPYARKVEAYQEGDPQHQTWRGNRHIKQEAEVVLLKKVYDLEGIDHIIRV